MYIQRVHNLCTYREYTICVHTESTQSVYIQRVHNLCTYREYTICVHTEYTICVHTESTQSVVHTESTQSYIPIDKGMYVIVTVIFVYYHPKLGVLLSAS